MTFLCLSVNNFLGVDLARRLSGDGAHVLSTVLSCLWNTHLPVSFDWLIISQHCIYSPLPPPKSKGENIPRPSFLSTQPYLQQQKKLEQFWAYINYNISWWGGECWFWEPSGIWYWSCAYRHMHVFRNTHKETQFYTKGIYINPLWSRRMMKTSLVFAGCIPYYWEVQSNQRDCRVVCVVMYLFRSNSIGIIFLSN